MNTLLLRLAAPIQSWGIESKFSIRATGREPTKSGVIGLCASALGIQRKDDKAIERLAGLSFGVRIDQPGSLLRDFHMAHKNKFWEGKKSGAFLSERYYLADAVFLAGLSGDDLLINEIEAALQAPKFPLFLGRRCCPPSGRVSLGIREKDLRDALCTEPSLASDWYRRRSAEALKSLEIIYDAEEGSVVRDLPVSFNQERRTYGFRSVIRERTAETGRAEHDALAALGGG